MAGPGEVPERGGAGAGGGGEQGDGVGGGEGPSRPELKRDHHDLAVGRDGEPGAVESERRAERAATDDGALLPASVEILPSVQDLARDEGHEAGMLVEEDRPPESTGMIGPAGRPSPMRAIETNRCSGTRNTPRCPPRSPLSFQPSSPCSGLRATISLSSSNHAAEQSSPTVATPGTSLSMCAGSTSAFSSSNVRTTSSGCQIQPPQSSRRPDGHAAKRE